MKGYWKEFLHRGLLFGGFGPIVMAIIYLCLQVSLSDFSLRGNEVFVSILSTYLLAFIHAGASVFHQIEEWSIAKSLFYHFLVLYLVYTLCYLINAWIPFEPLVLLIFTVAFVLGYFLICLIVFLSIRGVEKRLNGSLREQKNQTPKDV
jgi:hypothetical protein